MASIETICKQLKITDANIIKRAKSIQERAYITCTNLSSNFYAVPSASLDIATREASMDINQSLFLRYSGLTELKVYQRVVSTICNLLQISIVPSELLLFKKYHCEQSSSTIKQFIKRYNDLLLSSLPLSVSVQMKTPPYLVPLFIYLYCQHKDIHIDLDMIVKDSSIPKDQFLLKCEQVLELLPELKTKKQLDSEKKQQREYQKSVVEEVRNRQMNGETIQLTETTDLKRKKALEKSLEYLEWKKKVLDHKHVQKDKPIQQLPKKKQEQGNQQISSNTSKESSTEQSNKTTAPSASPNKTKKKQLSLDDMFH